MRSGLIRSITASVLCSHSRSGCGVHQPPAWSFDETKACAASGIDNRRSGENADLSPSGQGRGSRLNVLSNLQIQELLAKLTAMNADVGCVSDKAPADFG